MLSLFRPFTPRGLSSWWRSVTSTPAMSATRFTSPSIEISSDEPRLIGSSMSLCMIRSMPVTQSSMYMKLRVWVPSPHTGIS